MVILPHRGGQQDAHISIVCFFRECRRGSSRSGIQLKPNSMESPVLQVGGALKDSLGADTSDLVRKAEGHIDGSPPTTLRATSKDERGLRRALTPKTSVRRKMPYHASHGCHLEFSLPSCVYELFGALF